MYVILVQVHTKYFCSWEERWSVLLNLHIYVFNTIMFIIIMEKTRNRGRYCIHKVILCVGVSIIPSNYPGTANGCFTFFLIHAVRANRFFLPSFARE